MATAQLIDQKLFLCGNIIEEYIYDKLILIGGDSFIKKVFTVRDKTPQKRTYKKIARTQYESGVKQVAEIVDNEGVNIYRAFLKVFNRLPGGEEYIRIRKHLKHPYKTKYTKKQSSNKQGVQADRFRFINSRGWYLMKTFNYSREKAWHIASEFERKKVDKQKVEVKRENFYVNDKMLDHQLSLVHSKCDSYSEWVGPENIEIESIMKRTEDCRAGAEDSY